MANKRRRGGVEREVQRRARLRERPSDRPLTPSMWIVRADYRELEDGSWVAQVQPRRMPVTKARGKDLHETFHHVLDIVDALSDRTGAPVSTMHTIGGDPFVWSKLAYKQGFASCVSGDRSPHTAVKLTTDSEALSPSPRDNAGTADVGEPGR